MWPDRFLIVASAPAAMRALISESLPWLAANINGVAPSATSITSRKVDPPPAPRQEHHFFLHYFIGVYRFGDDLHIKYMYFIWKLSRDDSGVVQDIFNVILASETL